MINASFFQEQLHCIVNVGSHQLEKLVLLLSHTDQAFGHSFGPRCQEYVPHRIGARQMLFKKSEYLLGDVIENEEPFGGMHCRAPFKPASCRC
jgi:hypothetical protein